MNVYRVEIVNGSGKLKAATVLASTFRGALLKAERVAAKWKGVKHQVGKIELTDTVDA